MTDDTGVCVTAGEPFEGELEIIPLENGLCTLKLDGRELPVLDEPPSNLTFDIHGYKLTVTLAVRLKPGEERQ